MSRSFQVVFLSFVFLISNFFSIYSVEANEALSTVIDEGLEGTKFSIAIRDLHTGDLIYDYNGQVGMTPASTIKPLTAAAALNQLGEDYFFSTQLLMDGEVKNGILYGDLYLRGEGDPTLHVKDFVTFSKTMKRKGIRQVTGNLYGDQTWFSGDRLSPGIVPADESYYYGAPISALTTSPNEDYDVSTVIFTATGERVGRPPKLTVEPNMSGLRVRNEARTGPRGSRQTLTIRRNFRTNQVVISGNIPLGSTKKEWVTMFNPTLSTLHSFKNTLLQEGIDFQDGSRIAYGVTPKGAVSLGTKRSQPLKELLPTFMKLSNNGIADILVKTMGKQVYQTGDWEHGLAVIYDYGQRLGLNMADWQLEDGSGMSDANKVTAYESTLFLVLQRKENHYASLLNSFPIGGQRERLVGGTLRMRYTEAAYKNRVIAKTGSLYGVSALSGYFLGKSGNWYAFSVAVEHDRKKSYASQIDRIVKEAIRSF